MKKFFCIILLLGIASMYSSCVTFRDVGRKPAVDSSQSFERVIGRVAPLMKFVRYHDKANAVTCYRVTNTSGISCIKD